MPVLFLVVGTLFLVAAVRGRAETDKLLALIKSDFVGPNNFFVWALAIGSVAALGYSKTLKPFSNAFLVLIFIMLIGIKRGKTGEDFFTSFFRQVRSTEGTTT